ncbi:MAG: YtxH domain-containing protein [Ruminococcaceae bacterium]|nr:YtxH domain-containing protein [Oscillospiraceae bacterium]
MCKKFLDKMLCVSRKTCKVQSLKSGAEGMAIGIVVGSIGGIAVGMLLNSDAGKRMRNKMVCECIGNDCMNDNCN